MIRVLIVDDHGVVRAGLEQVLANTEDVVVVGTAANGEEAVAVGTETRPDVVLMDLSMPVLDGIEATRRLTRASPETSVVILTSFSDRKRIVEALDAGAVGYLLKDSEPDELVRGIQAAVRGESPLDSKAARELISAREERRPLDDLTARERDVLALLALGLANKQIARRLGISEKTVKTHVTRIFSRIGVHDRVQAALWAERHGVLEAES
ncbi:MAG: response regulator transcription factor [Actinomycetota bacterium]|nr:response regulator transcription factor [Actinomycetota bacterium]